jgi:phosphoglycerol transferase MdoB-like AlkP superfamily enzyme
LKSKGGFKKCYEKLQDSYTHTCGPPIYTLFGAVYYDYIRDSYVYTSEIGEEIKKWLGNNNAVSEHVRNDEPSRMNCIIILAESFESWVLEKYVENQEITPYLNKLLKDSATFFAPNVLTQVKGGRSIDAQLMINAGLLPINTGVYSLKYPNSFYPSLEKAMSEKYEGKSKSFILTADKPMTWNQNIIAVSFGFDSLVSKTGFIQDEKAGPHYRHQLGDVSLLRQCARKITTGETWTGEANIVQIVTYSGHFPFTLPEKLRKLSFSEQFPAMLRDYMLVANYTDRAIGNFIDSIRSEPQFENTLIVITGDHEGLMEMREHLCNTEKGNGLVSPYPFVPLIIVNAPASLRSRLIRNGIVDSVSTCTGYNRVMGQIDIYPTLLDLLGLSAYQWKGLGTSILNPDKPAIAINPQGKIYGDTTGVTSSAIQHLKDAWHVSDEIIKYDYFTLGVDSY